MKRHKYVRMQKEWTKNNRRAIKKILGATVESDLSPPKDVMVPYWRTVMETSTHATSEHSTPETTHTSLWSKITIEEASESLPDKRSAPGPDLCCNSVHLLVRSKICVICYIINIFLLNT